MGKIILSAGHTNVLGKDRGASGNGFIEGDEAAKMRRAIYDQLKAFGADVYRDPDNTVLSEALSHFRNITDANAICLEIHFNAATPKAKGTETFIENNPTQQERNLAEQLSKCVSDTLGIPMRGKNGVKLEKESQHKNGLGWMRMPGINVLMEICFISNPNEMKSYSENFLPLCCNIANVLYQFSQSCNQPTQSVYLVKSGDYLSKIAKAHNTTVSRLKALNGLKNDTIHVGEKLFV